MKGLDSQLTLSLHWSLGDSKTTGFYRSQKLAKSLWSVVLVHALFLQVLQGCGSTLGHVEAAHVHADQAEGDAVRRRHRETPSFTGDATP